MSDVINLVHALREREIAFPLFRTALHQNNLPVSQGWDRTIERLVDDLQNPKLKKGCEASIFQLYTDITFYGTKLIKIYENSEAETIKNLLDIELSKTENIYQKKFPLPLAQKDLIGAPMGPLCVYSQSNERTSTYIFCSKNYIYDREKIAEEYMSDKLIEDYGAFDEIVGVRRRPIQVFDLVLVDAISKKIQFRMGGMERQKIDDIKKRLDVLTKKINKLIDPDADNDLSLLQAVNFYPKIIQLYEEKDGRIKEIGHSTTTSGIHNGRTRSKKDDVRNDVFFEHGVKAISSIKAHTLVKCWDSPTGHGVISIDIPGTLGLTSEKKPYIDISCMLDCACEDDYAFLLNKLL
tara:strand:+ start:382 stop:1434 length:1053 start_codon:yes stop_codon:yes gene_type:complete